MVLLVLIPRRRCLSFCADNVPNTIVNGVNVPLRPPERNVLRFFHRMRTHRVTTSLATVCGYLCSLMISTDLAQTVSTPVHSSRSEFVMFCDTRWYIESHTWRTLALFGERSDLFTKLGMPQVPYLLSTAVGCINRKCHMSDGLHLKCCA